MGRFATRPESNLFILDLAKGTAASGKRNYNNVPMSSELITLATTKGYIPTSTITKDNTEINIRIDFANELPVNRRIAIGCVLPFPDDNWLYSLYTNLQMHQEDVKNHVFCYGAFGATKILSNIGGQNNIRATDIAMLGQVPIGHAQGLIQSHDNINTSISGFNLGLFGGVIIENEHQNDSQEVDCDLIVRLKKYGDTLEYRESIADF